MQIEGLPSKFQFANDGYKCNTRDVIDMILEHSKLNEPRNCINTFLQSEFMLKYINPKKREFLLGKIM